MGCLTANSSLTESFIRIKMVNTPRIVPNGENIHSTPATTRQNIHDTRFLSFLPAANINPARVHPAIINIEPKSKKNQPINAGGAASASVTSSSNVDSFDIFLRITYLVVNFQLLVKTILSLVLLGNIRYYNSIATVCF